MRMIPGACEVWTESPEDREDDGVQVPSACSEGHSPGGRRPITGLATGGHG